MIARSPFMCLVGISLVVVGDSLHAYSNLTNNDPYPVYTAADPHAFLTMRERARIKGDEESCGQDRFRFSISPFRQSATRGTNVDGISKEVIPPILNGTTVVTPSTILYTQLGDLKGRWNIPALFYPEPSMGSCAAPNFDIRNELIRALDCSGKQLSPAAYLQTLLVDNEINSPGSANDLSWLINPAWSDTTKKFGFFSVPIKYRKYGIRFEADLYLIHNFGLRVQTGVVDIKQVPNFADLTCMATGLSCPASHCTSTPVANPSNITGTSGSGSICEVAATTPGQIPPSPADCLTETACIDIYNATAKTVWIDQVMKLKQVIAKTLNYDIRGFDVRGIEDVRTSIWWRKEYTVNEDRASWPLFIFMPYFMAEFSIPTGRKANPRNPFSLPTGNNGHAGLGFSTGFNIDFAETIEIGFDASMTKWTDRTICGVPVPTNQLQAGMFPRSATVKVSPGTNWNFGLCMHAYHFLDRLSIWAQYEFISHGYDCFKILSTDAAEGVSGVLVDKMRAESKWESQVVNVGLTYDISPNFELGFLWQAPGPRRNAYRDTTIMLSLIMTF